jgi:hypothetical protein
VGLDLAQEWGFRAGNLDVRGLSVRTRRDDHGLVRKVLVASLAVALGVVACLSVWPKFHDPVTWTPDALYYQARLLEIRGSPHDAAFQRTFEGPLSAELRSRDPHHTGNPSWVKYNEPFYERRVALPLAGAALYPAAGDRSLLYLSLAGYVAAVVALFGLLLLRFRLWIAAAITLGAILLPPLRNHSSYPLTDSWGLALETLAFAAALITLKRGLRWIPLWIAAIALLGFTRDSTWIPVLAAGWLALRYRSRVPVTLFASGVAAALPALIAFATPVRPLLAELVNNSDPPADPSWGFIVRHYPHAVVDLVRADVGFLRRGEWYTALYLVGGVLALLLIVWRRRKREPETSLLTAGAFLGFAYVLAAPVFSAFRLELVFLPMAAYGLALVTERVAARVAERGLDLEGVGPPVPARARRP